MWKWLLWKLGIGWKYLGEKREFEGLKNAFDRLRIKNGLILTENQNETRTINAKKIIIQPIWQWLLEKE